jgi:hypothetical protein
MINLMGIEGSRVLEFWFTGIYCGGVCDANIGSGVIARGGS